MDVSRLAQNDGSRQAAGRGSGTDDPRWMEKRRPRNTPYMGMTYWPLERRLDTAVFRAMFASSVRAARQFCVHGHVKVNGKKV
jgi:ribosomal protein S4